MSVTRYLIEGAGMMLAKWYVEAYDRFNTHNGGFGDISLPFNDEFTARQYAEAQSYDTIALYKVQNNLFEHLDDFTARDTDERPRGWHADVTSERIDQHQYAVLLAYQQQQYDLEHSGEEIEFWVLRPGGGFAHGVYPTRGLAEGVIDQIRQHYPDQRPFIEVAKAGSGGMRFLRYDFKDN